MGQRDDGGVRIRLDGQHGVVRHAGHEAHGGRIPVVGIAFAWVTDQHLEAEAVSQVGDIARQLPGADHQQAPGGAKWGAQGMPVELQHSLTPGGLQDDRAAGHVQPAQQPLVCGTARQQLVDPAGIAQWLL